MRSLLCLNRKINLVFERKAKQSKSHTADGGLMERFESYVGSGVEYLHVWLVSNKQQPEVVAGRDPVTFWWASLCCQFRWNRNNQQSILECNSDCGSASIPSSIWKLTKILAVANQDGRNDQVSFINLFLFWCFQASERRASPNKSSELAVDLLSLGKTRSDLYNYRPRCAFYTPTLLLERYSIKLSCHGCFRLILLMCWCVILMEKRWNVSPIILSNLIHQDLCNASQTQ